MAGRVPERVLEEIAYRNDIVEVIGGYVTLKRAGSSYKGLCPFHKEKTPSFHVNPQRQTYHCFGCGKGGDVFKFLTEHLSMDFPTAIRTLAERAGITVEFGEDHGEGAQRRTLLDIHSELASKFHATLLKSPKAADARRYLEERALGKDTIEAFMIGYAPAEWDTVVKWAATKEYKLDQLIEAGLVVRSQKEGSDRCYDRFRDRIMFPIRNAQGHVVGFSGRVLNPEAKEAKYVNSPESPIFQKGRILYAFDMARTHIASGREALICEGQIDVIRCHQAGFTSAVASQGTAFTPDHVALIRRLADSVVLVFDGDTAGREAAVKTARLFLETGLAVRVGALPAGEDPDSFIRKNGADAFRAILDGAVSAVRFQATVAAGSQTAESEVGAMRLSRDVLQTILCTPNAVQQTRLLDDAAAALNVPRTALEEEMRRMARARPAPSRPAARSQDPEQAPAAARVERSRPEAEGPPREELMLCEHLVQGAEDADVRALVRKYLPLEMLTDPTCRAAAQLALEAGDSGVLPEVMAVDAEAAAPEAAELVRRLAHEPQKIRGREFGRVMAVRDQILAIWRRKLEREREQLGLDQAERRSQLVYDLHALRKWGEGHAIIEIELGV